MNFHSIYQAFLEFKKGFFSAPLLALAIVSLTFLGATPRVQADAVVTSRAMKSSTIAEVFIEEEHVKVTLEIGLGDLKTFQNLLPDDILTKMGISAPPLAERLPQFFAKDLTVQADGGSPIMGKILSMEGRPRITRDDITGEPVATADSEAVLVVNLIYPLVKSRPATLSIKPPSDQRGYASANIGFITYHQKVPVNDFRHLSIKQTIDLDWNDPWYSKFRSKNLWRRFNEPINVFLYVETFEVRVEIIARPKDLQQWIDLGVQGSDSLSVEIQPELKEKVAAFLAKEINLQVDGKDAAPSLDRIHFLQRTLRASTVIDPAEKLDLNGAVLGAIFVYRTTELSNQASLTWNLFSPKLPRIRAAATDEAGPLPSFLTPEHNVLEWKNYLTNPTVPALVPIDPPVTTQQLSLPALSIGLLVIAAILFRFLPKPVRPWACCVMIVAAVLLKNQGRVSVTSPVATAPQIADDQLAPTIDKLLHNIYVSFEFREEDDIYDKLARSVDGDLLADVYLETRKSLELENQGGAQVTIRKVEVVEVTEEPGAESGQIVATCKWNATGSVGHWGHIHQRTNQYDAKITLAVVDDEWKIIDLQLINENRIQ